MSHRVSAPPGEPRLTLALKRHSAGDSTTCLPICQDGFSRPFRPQEGGYFFLSQGIGLRPQHWAGISRPVGPDGFSPVRLILRPRSSGFFRRSCKGGSSVFLGCLLPPFQGLMALRVPCSWGFRPRLYALAHSGLRQEKRLSCPELRCTHGFVVTCSEFGRVLSRVFNAEMAILWIGLDGPK